MNTRYSKAQQEREEDRKKQLEQDRIEREGKISGVMFNPYANRSMCDFFNIPYDVMGKRYENEISEIINTVSKRSREKDRLSIHKLREMIENRARRAIDSKDPNLRLSLIKYIHELYEVAILIQ